MDETLPAGRPRVLVAYATATGTTAAIAARITQVLTASGATVTCRPVGPDLEPTGFDALVVGSAIHNMAWLPPALAFLRRVPSGTPLWCFSVGGADPRAARGARLAAMEAGRVRAGFPAGVSPVEHRLFGGVVRMAGVPLWGRIFYRVTGQREGDHRDWTGIEEWARGVGRALDVPSVSQPDVRP